MDTYIYNEFIVHLFVKLQAENVPESYLINLTHGAKQEQHKNAKLIHP